MKLLDMEIIEAIEAKNMWQIVEHAEEMRRKQSVSKGVSWMGALAVAACITIGIINSGNTSRMLKSSAEAQLDAFELQSLKGSDEIFDMLTLAVQNIRDGQYDKASSILDGVENEIVIADDATEQQKSIAKSCSEDIEWLRAIICMRKGKLRDSKQALRKIVKDKGYYQANAESILSDVYDK